MEPPFPKNHQWTMSQILRVLEYRQSGETYAAIGIRYNLSRGRIMEICQKGLRYQKRFADAALGY